MKCWEDQWERQVKNLTQINIEQERHYTLSPTYVVMHAYMIVASVVSISFFATLWTVTHQAPLPMAFSRQQYWSGLPYPPPGHLPEPRIKPASPAKPASRFFTAKPLRKHSHTHTYTHTHTHTHTIYRIMVVAVLYFSRSDLRKWKYYIITKMTEKCKWYSYNICIIKAKCCRILFVLFQGKNQT